MSALYPLRFKPIYKPKLWGGRRFNELFQRDLPAEQSIGESWEISGLRGDLSTADSGFLAGNNMEELVEVYMADLVGEANYRKYGIEFPLLLKLIDARQDLSVQVHPGDQLAGERHNAYGKTEMWYILEAERNAYLYLGFSRKVTREECLERIRQETLPEVLNKVPVHTGDVVFIEPGTVHSIGAGVVLAEIQQASDITYRMYDWGRKDAGGKSRDLHTDLAMDALTLTPPGRLKVEYSPKENRFQNLVDCPYFYTSILYATETVEKDYYPLDSFVILFCAAGEFMLGTEEGYSEHLTAGDSLLLPATSRVIRFTPGSEGILLETLIKSPENV